MTKQVWKKTVTLILGALLVGGMINTLTTTQAHADVMIPYSTYQSDLNGIESALTKASSDVKGDTSVELPEDPKDAYDSSETDSFANYFYALADSMDNVIDYSDPDTVQDRLLKENLECLNDSYAIFRSRLTDGERIQLDAAAANINNAIGNEDEDTVSDMEQSFGYSLGNAVSDYGDNYDGVATPVINTNPTPSSTPVTTAQPQATPAPKKSYIFKLSATTSKKYVKVTGSAKLYKSANYARIHTYKGNKYTKLNSNHNFHKKIYAPKAKTVKVTVGHYSNGHFTSVTSTKTVHVN
ncbi:hypothetical protein [Secundilactobacillus yichangensis]|uniref:hypothetical protein n=1 Tax=Secundilactobacillus yichangensis TaxID=2799580 RepID=UPI001944EE41|nr:hypothetical protein [Secundilactobacillus yichangensis]